MRDVGHRLGFYENVWTIHEQTCTASHVIARVMRHFDERAGCQTSGKHIIRGLTPTSAERCDMRASRIIAASAAVIAACLIPLGARQEPAVPQPLQAARAIARADEGVGRYFTAQQALRGKELFNRHCGYCHYVDLDKKPTMSGIQGPALAPRWIQRASEGRTRYPSVFYAFKRFEYMPVNDTRSITQHERADILAYVLEQNGLEAGPQELTPDYNAMRAMPLPAEPGFTHLFNGRDFTGWKFLLGYHCTPQPDGCGRTGPEDVFAVKDGLLTTTGRVHGMIYTEKKYLNFTLRVEQRLPFEWDDDDMLVQDQTGFFFFIGGPMRTWPDTFLEVEARYFDLMGAALVGNIKGKITRDNEARRRVIKRVNEWQQLEMVSKDGVMKNYLNGALITTVEHDAKEPGYIIMQSQGGPVEWRNIRIKVE